MDLKEQIGDFRFSFDSSLKYYDYETKHFKKIQLGHLDFDVDGGKCKWAGKFAPLESQRKWARKGILPFWYDSYHLQIRFSHG